MSRADPLPGEPPSPAVSQLERIVAAFEDAWQRGQRPAIDAALPSAATVRRAVLVELIHADLEYRLKAGEAARVETYLEQYPDLVGEALSRWLSARVHR